MVPLYDRSRIAYTSLDLQSPGYPTTGAGLWDPSCRLELVCSMLSTWAQTPLTWHASHVCCGCIQHRDGRHEPSCQSRMGKPSLQNSLCYVYAATLAETRSQIPCAPLQSCSRRHAWWNFNHYCFRINHLTSAHFKCTLATRNTGAQACQPNHALWCLRQRPTVSFP